MTHRTATDWTRLADAELTHDLALADKEWHDMTEKIKITELPDGSLTEADADVAWVRDSYTEPREYLFECCVCEAEIEDWDLMTCLDGGEAAHRSCVEITPALPLDIDITPAAPGPAWVWPEEEEPR